MFTKSEVTGENEGISTVYKFVHECKRMRNKMAETEIIIYAEYFMNINKKKSKTISETFMDAMDRQE